MRHFCHVPTACLTMLAQQQAVSLNSQLGHAALQLTLDRSSVTSLEIGALSAVAVVNATLNVTGSTFTGMSHSQASSAWLNQLLSHADMVV